MEEVLTRKRLTREESRAQTRERLMDAALAVFVKDGVEGTSIEEVAEAAGYSRGAFYSNFESKDDLLCAVLDREIQRDTQEFDAIVAGIPAPEMIGKLREYYVNMGKDEAGCAFWLELQLHSLRNPAIRPQVAAIMRKKRAHVITQTRRVFEEIRKEPPGSVETVALGLISIAQGLGLTQMLDPESIPPELLSKTLETLFDQVTGVRGVVTS